MLKNNNTANLEKYQYFKRIILDDNNNAYIHFNPHTKDVIVPQHLRYQHQVVFEIGLDMNIPIDDLEYTVKDGISATLSFNGKSVFCNVPWESVFAIVNKNHDGMVWEDEMPEQIRAQIAAKIAARSSASHDEIEYINEDKSEEEVATPSGVISIAKFKKNESLKDKPTKNNVSILKNKGPSKIINEDNNDKEKKKNIDRSHLKLV